METSTPKIKDKRPNRIRELRENRGMTQAELAVAIGTAQSHIAAFEAGRRLGMKRLLLLANYFDVDPRYLVGHKDIP